MALPDYARNVFAPQQLGDVSLVTIVIGASGRVAARSSPDTTVATGVAGAYVCTMPGGVGVISIAQETVNAGTDKMTITSLSTTSGVTTFTATKSDGVNATGSEEIHLAFLVIGA